MVAAAPYSLSHTLLLPFSSRLAMQADNLHYTAYVLPNSALVQPEGSENMFQLHHTWCNKVSNSSWAFNLAISTPNAVLSVLPSCTVLILCLQETAWQSVFHLAPSGNPLQI